MRLMGIIENNGSFVVNIIKNNKYSCGYGCGINFTFRSAEKDLLEYIQSFLKERNIDSNIKDNQLMIVGEQNLQKFCKFIDDSGFISMKRQEEFLMFKKILYMYMHREHLTIEGINKIKEIKK